jgi:hypothetical protein
MLCLERHLSCLRSKLTLEVDTLAMGKCPLWEPCRIRSTEHRRETGMPWLGVSVPLPVGGTAVDSVQNLLTLTPGFSPFSIVPGPR